MTNIKKKALDDYKQAVSDMEIAQVCIDTLNRFSFSDSAKAAMGKLIKVRHSAYIRFLSAESQITEARG